MLPANARTRSPASGSSRAPARSPSTPATVEVFFARPVLRMLIQQPLVATNRQTQYDVICTVSGGGLSGQAGAVRHGISQGADLFRAGPAQRAQARRLPHPRLARGRAQEVRPGQGAPFVPVLETLNAIAQVRACFFEFAKRVLRHPFCFLHICDDTRDRPLPLVRRRVPGPVRARVAGIAKSGRNRWKVQKYTFIAAISGLPSVFCA